MWAKLRYDYNHNSNQTIFLFWSTVLLVRAFLWQHTCSLSTCSIRKICNTATLKEASLLIETFSSRIPQENFFKIFITLPTRASVPPESSMQWSFVVIPRTLMISQLKRLPEKLIIHSIIIIMEQLNFSSTSPCERQAANKFQVAPLIAGCNLLIWTCSRPMKMLVSLESSTQWA